MICIYYVTLNVQYYSSVITKSWPFLKGCALMFHHKVVEPCLLVSMQYCLNSSILQVDQESSWHMTSWRIVSFILFATFANCVVLSEYFVLLRKTRFSCYIYSTSRMFPINLLHLTSVLFGHQIFNKDVFCCFHSVRSVCFLCPVSA